MRPRIWWLFVRRATEKLIEILDTGGSAALATRCNPTMGDEHSNEQIYGSANARKSWIHRRLHAMGSDSNGDGED
jgi:hypothetical protein